MGDPALPLIDGAPPPGVVAESLRRDGMATDVALGKQFQRHELRRELGAFGQFCALHGRLVTGPCWNNINL